MLALRISDDPNLPYRSHQTLAWKDTTDTFREGVRDGWLALGRVGGRLPPRCYDDFDYSSGFHEGEAMRRAKHEERGTY